MRRPVCGGLSEHAAAAAGETGTQRLVVVELADLRMWLWSAAQPLAHGAGAAGSSETDGSGQQLQSLAGPVTPAPHLLLHSHQGLVQLPEDEGQ
jgi:hypothetical protein